MWAVAVVVQDMVVVSRSAAIMDLVTECVKKHATDVKQGSEGAYVTFPRFDRTTGLFGLFRALTSGQRNSTPPERP